MKSRKVMIIDYGMGNLHSIMNAFKYLNIETDITNNPKKISNSNILILPGVGSFHQAMTQIKKKILTKQFTKLSKKEIFYLAYVSVCNYSGNQVLKISIQLVWE